MGEDDSVLSNDSKKYISFDLEKETEKINLEKQDMYNQET